VDLVDWFWGNEPQMDDLHKVFKKIIVNLEKVKKIPPGKRTYHFWQSELWAKRK
jgi:hypothetical protein